MPPMRLLMILVANNFLVHYNLSPDLQADQICEDTKDAGVVAKGAVDIRLLIAGFPRDVNTN